MSMTEEFQKRQAEKPDKWTISWWSEQFRELQTAYRGANHGINMVLAENEDLRNETRGYIERIQALEVAAELDRAKIGELQAKLAKSEERLDRQAEFLNTLKQKKEKPA